MKRMTTSEVVAEIERRWLARAIHSDTKSRHESAIYAECLNLIRDNLVPQWQDEPDGNGQVCYVRGLAERVPLVAYRDDNERWRVCGNIPVDREWCEIDEPLNGRQVCPVSPPPEVTQ